MRNADSQSPLTDKKSKQYNQTSDLHLDRGTQSIGNAIKSNDDIYLDLCINTLCNDIETETGSIGIMDKVKNLSTNARRRFALFMSSLKIPKTFDGNIEKVTDCFAHLDILLSNEQLFGPSVESIYEIDPERSDMVDGSMRDDAVFNLYVLHKSFYQLTAATFCRAVHIIDQFIVRVRVKPKFMDCVAAASYYLAAEDYGESERPSAEHLVNVTRCGGTPADLIRMVSIIRNKLKHYLTGTTTLDYLEVFRTLASVFDSKMELVNEANTTFVNSVLVSLTCLRVRQFSPSCLAVAAMLVSTYTNEDGTLIEEVPLFLDRLIRICQISASDVSNCISYIQTLYSLCFLKALPCSRAQLVWSISRRTSLSFNMAKYNRERLRTSSLRSITEVDECFDESVHFQRLEMDNLEELLMGMMTHY